jgi:hypothetical protein
MKTKLATAVESFGKAVQPTSVQIHTLAGEAAQTLANAVQGRVEIRFPGNYTVAREPAGSALPFAKERLRA